MFIDALTPLDRGTFLHKCEQAVDELFRRCDNLQKAGTLTLKLAVKPEGPGQFAVIADVDTKLPRPAVAP